MAPSRRKKAAAAAAAARRQWKVGDLVLAKVKGFPAWPATVSEPEKWGYSADWKKVLVYFFGTQQIAFCNPADVEAFTEEKKQSLLTKRHGKGSDFVRAVKEIIESYEKLKNQEQVDNSKSVNDATLEDGGNSAVSLQVREIASGASSDTQLKSDSSKGGDESALLSEDASAAEQMLALRDNDMPHEQPADSVTTKQTCKITTYSSRKRYGGSQSQKGALPRRSSMVQQSRSSSKVETHRFQGSMLQCNDGGQGVDDMDDGALRRRKRIRRPSGAPESDVVGSSALNSNGTDEDNASEIATVDSDSVIGNEGNGVDSNPKLENSDATIVECSEGDHELNKGLDFQIKSMFVKKKRKPSRKRSASDIAEPAANVNVVADLEAGAFKASQNCQSSQVVNECDRPSKENGDEHLPLVKRARVRMSRACYTDDEVNTSLQVEEKCSKNAAINMSGRTSPTSNHENDTLSSQKPFAAKESLIFPPKISKITDDNTDVILSAEKRSSGDGSSSKSCAQSLGNKPDGLEDTRNKFGSSPNSEAALPVSKQLSSSSDDEAVLPQSKQLKSSPDEEVAVPPSKQPSGSLDDEAALPLSKQSRCSTDDEAALPLSEQSSSSPDDGTALPLSKQSGNPPAGEAALSLCKKSSSPLESEAVALKLSSSPVPEEDLPPKQLSCSLEPEAALPPKQPSRSPEPEAALPPPMPVSSLPESKAAVPPYKPLSSSPESETALPPSKQFSRSSEPEAALPPAKPLSGSPESEADSPLPNQSRSSPDVEAALPPCRDLYCSMEATSANVVQAVQECSGGSSTMNKVDNRSDLPAGECSHKTNMSENYLELDSIDSSANNASGLFSILNSTISKEPAESSLKHESLKHSCREDIMVKSIDCLKDKHYDDNTCTIQTVVQSEAIEHSHSNLSFPSPINKSKAENFQLSEGPESWSTELQTSGNSQMIQNPGFSFNNIGILPQVGVPQYDARPSNCEDADTLKSELVDNNQLNDRREAVEEVKKEHVQNIDSVSVSENHSCAKMSLSPADLADSLTRGTPHSNSGCHISTAESANVTQNNGCCSPNVQFHQKKIFGDASAEEGEKISTDVPQRPKSGSFTSNYEEVQSALLLFENMLGSLARTKESIGRATRSAIDFAKFGLSAKVMEILANNLENESNLQRRVDLFFLVDSIAQCSRGLKGDAGGGYLSSIQAMLPRLLFAAAPPGGTTQENRRQCLKVLRLWLERRILPESVIRQHIKELDSHGSSFSACLYSRRSARTERALDDPVRDMEGMLVDEYGSNSTLQIPGFCMPSMLKDEDEGSDSDGGDFEAVTPEHNSGVQEELQVISSAVERHTHILEDVDGELEMEDLAPSCDIGIKAYSNCPQDDTARTSHSQFGQQLPSSISHLPQDVPPSSSPPLPPSSPPPPPPPPHPAQCAMSDSYSNGFDSGAYPSMHGDHASGPPSAAPRINPPMPSNNMHYQGPEAATSYSDSRNFQHRPYPPCPPHPPPPNQFSYMQQGHHVKSRREAPQAYSHRSHYIPNFNDRNFHDNHERMRPAPYESRENWGFPPPSYGPRYHDKPKAPYGQGSYSGPPREPSRFQNQRWAYPPRPFNHRNNFHNKPHSEGPVPVGMRDPSMWHQR